MKLIYSLRVALFSFEFLILVSTWLAWVYFRVELGALSASLELNQEIIKYMMFAPAGIAVWVFNEARLLLQEDKETIRILTAWDDYWRLKTHIWVTLAYAVLFALSSLLPWIFKGGIGTGAGLLLFLCSIAGQLALAASIYAARIRMKEIIVQMKAP